MKTSHPRYGPVPLGLVKARAFVRIWPPHEASLIRSHYDAAEWPSEPDEQVRYELVLHKIHD